MSSCVYVAYPASRLTILDDTRGTITDVPIAAVEHHQLQQLAVGGVVQGPTSLSNNVEIILKQFTPQPMAVGSRSACHERRSSAPPAAVTKVATQRQYSRNNAQDEAEMDIGSVEDDLEGAVSGRLSGPVPTDRSITLREGRRSSWAPGVLLELCPGRMLRGHEVLSPDELYRQFITIRDAVIQKGKAAGRSGKGPKEAKEVQTAPLDTLTGSGSHERTRNVDLGDRSVGNKPTDECPLRCGARQVVPASRGVMVEISGDGEEHGRATTSSAPSPPDSPYKNALAIAAYAARAGTEGPALLTRGADVEAMEGSHGPTRLVGAQLAGGDMGHKQPTPSPDMIDLQAYYYSPAASSNGAGPQMSPCEAIATNVSEYVSYNALYGCASARLKSRENGATPRKQPSAQEVGASRQCCSPVAAVSRVEPTCSMSGTDSLFTLTPSGEALASIIQQQSELTLQPSGCRNMPCQEATSLNADTTVASIVEARASHEPLATARSSVRFSNSRCKGNSQSSATMVDSGMEAAGGRGVDMVVHPGRGGNSGFTPDYLKAVQSAAQKTLLPLPRMQSSGGGVRGGGGACGHDGSALLNSGWAALAAAWSNSGVPRKTGASAATSGGGMGEASATYEGYVALPLSGLPPPPPAPTAMGPADLPPPLAMHASPPVAAATAAVVTRCLDKGFPFAIIPTKHYATMITAAEQHDGPLAFHILSRHCVYYPGVGRHAASSGGGPSLSEPICNGGNPAGGTCPKVGAISTPTKAAASAAAAAASSSVRELLAGGDALHVMSPCEYQRLQLAAQYSLRQLHEMLVAQPAVSAVWGAESGLSACAEPELTPFPAGTSGGRVVRHHKRGSSICSESNFSAAVVRFNSGLDGMAATDLGRTSARKGHAVSLSAGQDTSIVLHPANRVKALIQAAQLGNMSRVAFLVKHGVDVNAVEQQQQHHGSAQGVRGALVGACTGAGAAGGRTALHYAALAGSFGVAQLLLYHGAFAGVRDATGRTAYDLARRKGHDAVAQLLKDALERRRDVVRGCTAAAATTAAETRVITPGAVATRAVYPPPVPPRSKQLRSSSAPASGSVMDGPPGAISAPRPNALSLTDIQTTAAVLPSGCSYAGEMPLTSQSSSSANSGIHASPTAGAPGTGDCAAVVFDSQVGMDRLRKASCVDALVKNDTANAQLASVRSKGFASEVSPNDIVDLLGTGRTEEDGADMDKPAAGEREGTGRARRNGGILACFLCSGD